MHLCRTLDLISQFRSMSGRSERKPQTGHAANVIGAVFWRIFRVYIVVNQSGFWIRR
jgi:hypothetical protein